MEHSATQAPTFGSIGSRPRSLEVICDQDILKAIEDNIRWYARAADRCRLAHYVLGLGVILGQVALLASFTMTGELTRAVSSWLAIFTSSFVALYGFLSPGAKWKVFRTAEHNLRAQRVQLLLDLTDCQSKPEQLKTVLEKHLGLGMRIVGTAAEFHWRDLDKAAEALNRKAPA
jgi:hypothetical protein